MEFEKLCQRARESDTLESLVKLFAFERRKNPKGGISYAKDVVKELERFLGGRRVRIEDVEKEFHVLDGWGYGEFDPCDSSFDWRELPIPLCKEVARTLGWPRNMTLQRGSFVAEYTFPIRDGVTYTMVGPPKQTREDLVKLARAIQSLADSRELSP